MQQEIAAYGDWDAQLLEIHAGQLDLIQNNENVQTIMVKGDNQTALLPAASGLPYLLIQNCDGAYWGGMREKNLILRGRVPQAPGEIVVGKSFFEQNPSVEIGDRLNLDLGERRKGNTTVDFLATVYKGNIIKNLIMDCQSYTKYRPNETTGGIFVSWRRKEELPTGA